MTDTFESQARPSTASPSGAWVPLALVCGAQFVLQLDFSIVNVALPSIQRDLGLAPAQLQWIVTGYALTFGSLLLAGGRAADLLGRRRLLVIGLSTFAVASLGAGLAQSAVMLIVARVIQGAGGAMVSPAALSLLTTTNPEGAQRTRALGIWQAATAAGATAGIIVGGLLTQYLGWRAIFLVNPPLIAVMLAFVPRVLPAGAPNREQRLDARGAMLGTASLAAFIFGLSNGQQHGFGAPTSVGALAAGVALAVAFVVAERRVSSPMLPLSLFGSPTRRAAIEAMLLLGAILAGYVYFASLYLQRVRGLSPVLTGLALVPSTVTVVLTATFATRPLLARVGVKNMLVAGLVAIGAGQLWLANVTAGSTYVWSVLPGLLLTALGIGLALPTASVAITSGVDHRDQGLAGGLFVTGQQAGAAVGLAILAAIAASRSQHDHALVSGYRLAFLVAGCLAAAAIVLVLVQLNARACEEELSRQRASAGNKTPVSAAEASLRKV